MSKEEGKEREMGEKIGGRKKIRK